MSGTQALEVYRYHLEPGKVFALGEPALISAVLGTCVAVCLHDRRLKIGGMNHFLYPRTKMFSNSRPDPQYAEFSIPALIKQMQKKGCRTEDLEAQIFGGSQLMGLADSNLGEKNIKMARRLLKKNGIRVVSEDVGGFKGRRLIYHTGTNETMVMKTHRLRRGDYYPYRQRLGA